MITYTNSLDFCPGGVPLFIRLSQYDSNFSLVFNCFSHKGNFTVESGSTAVFREHKPDGNVISIDATVSETTVTLTPSAVNAKQMTAIKGHCECEISLQKNGKELSSANFVLLVEKAPVDIDAVQSDSVVRELYDVADRAEEILEAAETVDEAISDLPNLIDSTLTLPNHAADAKKTGDEISSLKSAVEQIDNVLTVASSDVSLWESGGINLPDGQDYETNTRIRTDYISRDIAIVNPSNGYQIGIYVYDSSDAYLGMYNGTDYSTTVPYWYSLNADLTEIPSGYNIRLLARKESNESIAPADATNVLFGSYLDTSLTMSGKAADAKAVGDRLTTLEEEIEDIEPLSNDIKEALLTCFEHVVWTDHDEDYYQALYNALYTSDLVSISATFTQGTAIIYQDESLTNLRLMLVVTGLYGDGSTRTITGYTLSGTLVGGTTSTITVSYQGKTTTFGVVVTDYEWGSDYTWLYRAGIDGLLSDNENVSATVGINGTLATETLDGNNLNVFAPYTSASSGNIYKLIPITGDGVLKAKVRFHALAKSLSASGLRIQVSNGTNGAQMFAYRNAQADTYRISSHQGDTQYLLVDNIEFERWYILSCELQGNKQVLKVDDATYTINSLSNYANTETRVIVQQPGALSGYSDIGDVDVDIAWVSFKDNSVQ